MNRGDRFIALVLGIALVLANAAPAFATSSPRDIGGDGHDDVPVMYDYGEGRVGFWAFESNGTDVKPRNLLGDATRGWTAARADPMLRDVTGEGRADIVIRYDYGNGTTGLWVVAGKAAPSLSWPAKWWQSGTGKWGAAKSKFTTSKTFSGSGPGNPVALYDYGNGSTGIWVFTVHSASMFTPHLVWKSAPGKFYWSRSKVVGGDFNGDGFGDIAILYDYGSNTTGIWLFQSDGAAYVGKLAWKSGAGKWSWKDSQPLAADMDNDGKDELVVRYIYPPDVYGARETGFWVFNETGTMTAPGMTASRWAKGHLPPWFFPVTLADFATPGTPDDSLNPDGKADLLSFGSGTEDMGSSLDLYTNRSGSFTTDGTNSWVLWEGGGWSYDASTLVR